MPLLLRRLAALFAIVGCLAACAVALLTVSSVSGRALVARPVPGDVELTQFGIALCIALCLPWAQLHGSNIIVDFFTQKAAVRDAFETTMILGLPMWITYAVLAPGLALTAVIALVQVKLHLQGRGPHPEPMA
jgi:TRAP-type C4-dicarboxylate transport system permease small subunit